MNVLLDCSPKENVVVLENLVSKCDLAPGRNVGVPESLLSQRCGCTVEGEPCQQVLVSTLLLCWACFFSSVTLKSLMKLKFLPEELAFFLLRGRLFVILSSKLLLIQLCKSTKFSRTQECTAFSHLLGDG